MKKVVMILACLFASIGLSVAQTMKVSGTVVDDTGEPAIGASVVAKGTTQGAVTDLDGKFSFDVSAGTKTLVISLIGMKKVEVPAGTNIKVVLETDSKMMDEVIVTALGLKRDEKSIGYAASKVKSDDLNRVVPVSVAGGLTGKVAGLNISSAGGTGTSEKVIIRGFTSFNNNQPLYVVDGVPIQNSVMGQTTSVNQAVDFGNQAGDINPEDVESVTVLKGASATALYGSRAANGVIVITTKRGGTNSKLSVNYTGTATVSNVLRVPQFQDRFGQGWPFMNFSGQPESGAGENGSWGPRLDGMDRPWGAPINAEGFYTPVSEGGVQRVKPYAFVKDNLRNFYENGLEVTNNLSVSAGDKNKSIIVSYNNVSSNGVIPGDADKYIRNTFSVRGDMSVNKLRINMDMTYVRKDIDQPRAGQGGAMGATTFQEIVQIPVDVNLQDLKDYNSPYNNLDNFYTGYAQNPYWILDNNRSVYQDDRIQGKVEVNYDIIKGLKAMGRVGADFTNSLTKSWAAKVVQSPTGWSMQFGSSEIPGNYEENILKYGQLDGTFMLSADYQLGKDIRYTGTAGWNYNQRTKYQLDAIQGALDVAGWYNLMNGASGPTINATVGIPVYTRRLIGAFATADFSYKDWVYLGLSARNDWSSTLPIGKNSYFYGGINYSIMVTDLLKEQMKDSFVSFLKLRGGLGQTGNDAEVYRTERKFLPTQASLGFGYLYMPLMGVSGLTESNTIYNQDLKPEITTEIELGFDLRMLKNRIGIDFAWYNKTTKDQIIIAALAAETGYTGRVRNIGEINNKGVELRVYGTPIQTPDFQWDLGVTYAKNKSMVNKLWDDVKSYQITSAYDITYMAIVGQPLGIFMSPKLATVTDQTSEHFGKVIVNSSGVPNSLNNEYENLGTSTPDFTMGFTSTWKYKDLSLNMVVDYRKGGLFYSNTARMLEWNGNGVRTMFNDRQPFLVPNSVKQLASGAYVENDIPLMTSGALLNYYNYSSSNKGMESNAVLSRTYVKLREISLSYMLPRKIFAKTPISGAQISLIAKNLLMWTAAENNFVDPDQTNYGNDIDSNFGEFSAAPTVRNVGVSLKLNF